MVKNPSAMWETQGQSLGREGPLEKGMDTHSSILPGDPINTGVWQAIVQTLGSQRIRPH